jgi:acyl carrier protein
MQTSIFLTAASLEKIIRKFTPPECARVAIQPDTHLIDELGIDSARMIDIVLDVEDTFNITVDDNEIHQTKTFGDLLRIVSSKVPAKGANA